MVFRQGTRLHFRWALLVALAGLTLLAGCSSDLMQQQICADIIPALETEDPMIAVVSAESVKDAPVAIVDYATGGEGIRWTSKRIVCRFGGSGFATERQTLSHVEIDNVPVGEAQLWALNRFWLGEIGAVAEGRHRIVRQPHDGSSPALGYFLQQFVNAGVVSAIYVMLAVAYALVYGVTNRINLAFGEMATVGAYGAVVGVAAALAIGRPDVAGALAIAVAMAMAVTVLAGDAIGRLVFLPLMQRRSAATIVATLGAAIALQEALRLAQGTRERWLQPILNEPHILLGGAFPVIVTTMQAAIVAATVFVIAALIISMRKSAFGRNWRAVADDPKMAGLLGIDPADTVLKAFSAAAVLAGLTGAVLTLHYGGTSFSMGTIIGLKALVAAIVGGIGSPAGAALGGLLIGLLETFWSAYLPMAYRDAMVLGVLIVVLILRPGGLIGPRLQGKRP
ncbi:MAG: branched-chain amino acid ABC transporter permease [Hyphomicrobiales bacterium]